MQRLRAALAPIGFALFACQFALIELLVPGMGSWFHGWTWVSAFSSVAIWSLLGISARGGIARGVLSILAAAVLVSELLFFRYYHAFLGDDAIACALSMWSDVRGVLYQMLPGAALGMLLVGALEFFLLSFTPKLRRRSVCGIGAAALGLTVCAINWHTVSPELNALWSLRLFLKPREASAEQGVEVLPLESRAARMPNVLLILDESVRANDYALASLEARDEAWRALVGSRVELREMRSLASYTAISVNALLSGIMPLGSRAEVAATPLVFDYLRATRAADTRPRTLYWSVQGSSPFERRAPYHMADSVAFLDDVLGRRFESIEEAVKLGADSRLADWVARRLPNEPRPLFLMTHLIDTHAPYHVDPEIAPFLPYSHTVTWSGLDALHNAYRNAILSQDRSVLRIVRSFIDSVGAEPYFILFTSDHGEAFGEHDAIHHGQNLYDEQIHVPAWIAFGNGVIDPDQEHWLRSHADHFLTHLDILPTLLDLYGIWDAFALVSTRKKLQGRSLLRPFTGASAILPINNCTALFPCPLQSYGVEKDGVALQAQPWNDGWRCNTQGTRGAPLALDAAPCVELRQASKVYYSRLPNGRPNR